MKELNYMVMHLVECVLVRNYEARNCKKYKFINNDCMCNYCPAAKHVNCTNFNICESLVVEGPSKYLWRLIKKKNKPRKCTCQVV